MLEHNIRIYLNLLSHTQGGSPEYEFEDEGEIELDTVYLSAINNVISRGLEPNYTMMISNTLKEYVLSSKSFNRAYNKRRNLYLDKSIQLYKFGYLVKSLGVQVTLVSGQMILHMSDVITHNTDYLTLKSLVGYASDLFRNYFTIQIN